jgi:DNA-directed RNA polymerase alpha subunit
VRATNCLYRTDYKFFGEVLLHKEADLYRIPNFGRKSGKEISDLVHEFGLRFEMSIPGWSIEKAIEVRQFISSQLPANVALTNLIRKGATSELKFVPPTPIKFGSPVVEEETSHFDKWPIERRVLLVATPAELPLPPRIANALSHAGYVHFGEVVQLSMHNLLKIKNLGKTSAGELSELLHNNGLRLGMTVNRRSNLTPHRRPILTPLGDGFWR